MTATIQSLEGDLNKSNDVMTLDRMTDIWARMGVDERLFVAYWWQCMHDDQYPPRVIMYDDELCCSPEEARRDWDGIKDNPFKFGVKIGPTSKI